MHADAQQNAFAPSRGYMAPRTSLGVACCRIHDGRPEILLVCKRFSYALNTFVCGRYNPSSNAELMQLFNNMTVDEKHDILSLNFSMIWYRVRSTMSKTPNYFVAKNKFEATFLVDGGVRIRRLISRSTHIQRIWEIPKGRKRNKTEPDIHCAVREFHEETGISKKNYKIFPQSRSDTYIDCGTRYTNIYYFALIKHNVVPRINFAAPEQTNEISDIRWMDIGEVRLVDTNHRLVRMIRPIFNFIRKRARG